MKKNKVIIAILYTLISSFSASAQLKFPVTNNGLRNDLEKVINDYSKDFATLKGDVIVENPQSIEYVSLLKFSGAEENRITKYNSNKDIYSWQAIMLTTEDFDAAAKKYRWLYKQLKNMTIKLDGYDFSLDGEFEEPTESRSFVTSPFRLLPGAVNLKKFKIELTMNFEFPEWKVSLQMYQKEREDNERGSQTDN